MKKIVWVYGIITGVLILGISGLVFSVFGASHAQSELLGYLVMIIALSLIFIATKQYRDKHLGGVIKFKTAFIVGLYITLIASTIYVANWEVYMQTSGSDGFIESYQAGVIKNMEANGATEAEIQATKEQHEYYTKIYSNTFFRVLITASEILPVGLAITLISSLLLKNPALLPASETDKSEVQPS